MHEMPGARNARDGQRAVATNPRPVSAARFGSRSQPKRSGPKRSARAGASPEGAGPKGAGPKGAGPKGAVCCAGTTYCAGVAYPG